MLLLAQLFTGAGLPAGALNVLTGSDMQLGAKVAQSANVSYVSYSGNKPVRVGETGSPSIHVLQSLVVPPSSPPLSGRRVAVQGHGGDGRARLRLPERRRQVSLHHLRVRRHRQRSGRGDRGGLQEEKRGDSR